MGSICALGRGIPALWSGIDQGLDGMVTIRRFSTDGIKSKIAGMIPDKNFIATAAKPISRLNIEFALDAAREAWEMARLNASGILPERIGLVFGTSLGDFEMPLHQMAEAVAAELGVRGPVLTVSTACSSSTNAIGLGLDLLRQGCVDAVIAGGADVLNPIMLAGFNSLGVLSSGKCAPFSHPFGTTLGEGAGFLVLERADTAPRPGIPIRGTLEGYGLSGDSYHDTSPDPTGSGVARALSGALHHSGIHPEQIAYVNAHGTGTAANDPAEWKAIQMVFGERSTRLPVSSTKSYLGHAQGAAGVLEIIVTLLSMESQVIPPTLNYTEVRKQGPADPVFSPRPRPHPVQYSLCTNSAFGGANAAVVVGVPDAPRPRLPFPVSVKTVHVTGLGIVGPHGIGLEAIIPAMENAVRLNSGRVPDFSWPELFPTVDRRGLDPASRFLTASIGLAMADACLPVKRARDDRMGLILGTINPSPESVVALHRSIKKNGLPLLSTTAFSRMVLNAPAGTSSKLLSLGGPLSTISTGWGSGLAAIVYAADILRNRDDADVMAAGGLDEFDPEFETAVSGEGAACALLTSLPAFGKTPIAVTGWGMAGPNHLTHAIQTALAMAGIGEHSLQALFGAGMKDCLPEIPHRDPTTAFGLAPAFSPALAFNAAVLWLRLGKAQHVLVADGNGQSLSCAIILSRGKT